MGCKVLFIISVEALRIFLLIRNPELRFNSREYHAERQSAFVVMNRCNFDVSDCYGCARHKIPPR
jgi:hypothetical protein